MDNEHWGLAADDKRWGLVIVFDLDEDQDLLDDIGTWCAEMELSFMLVVSCTQGPDGAHRVAVFLEHGKESEAAMLWFWPQCRSAGRTD